MGSIRNLILVASLFGGALILSNPVYAKEEGKVFHIPVKVLSRAYIPKFKEKVPKTVPIEVSVVLNAEKVGLYYPKEIFKPDERVKKRRGLFSCGGPEAEEIYYSAVSYFKKGNFAKAEGKFKKLIYLYPEHPLVLKAKYYLGYIYFQRGNYKKAYEIFKELGKIPYTFSWKKFAKYNAVISGLYLGIKDYEAAQSHEFWRLYLDWLSGKVGDSAVYSYDCNKLEIPYRNYCLYLKAFINPSIAESQIPPEYRKSVEVRRLISSLLSGSFTGQNLNELKKYFNLPDYGVDVEYIYIYYLLNYGRFNEALPLIVELYGKNPEKGLELAKLYASRSLERTREILRYINAPELWKLYIKELYNLGRYSEVLNLAPKYGLYKLAAYSAYKLGKYDIAAKYFAKAETLTENDYRLWLDSLLRTKNWKRFMEVLNRIKTIYPETYKEFLGWYYYAKGDFAKAINFLKYKLYKAVAYLNLGAYENVIRELENDNSYSGKLIKAKAFLSMGRYDAVLKTLQGLDSPEALYLKGLASFAKGDFVSAVNIFKKLLTYTDKYPLAIVKLADSYYNLGDYRKAKYYYLKYIRSFPKGEYISDAYIGLINIYTLTGDPSLADYIYGILKKYPHLVSEEVKLKLAEGLVKNGKTEKAKEILNELVKSNNNYIKAQAMLLLAEIEPSKKVEYLKKVIQIGEPQQKSEAVIELVEYYISKGDKRKAETTLVRYENLITDFDRLVELYIRLGDFDRLYNLLMELIPVNVKYADKAYYIAKNYRRIEFYKLATYSKDAKIVTDAVKHLTDFYLKKGNLKDALKTALILKVRNIKLEPTYSKLYLKLAKVLNQKGYKTDACTLLKEVNTKYLSTEEKLTYETLKVDCSK